MLVTGVDIIEIPRIRRVADRYGNRFYGRVYTEREVVYCRGRAPQLASRFAAKEAVMKALGTGTRGVRWQDIEVVRERGAGPDNPAPRQRAGTGRAAGHRASRRLVVPLRAVCRRLRRGRQPRG